MGEALKSVKWHEMYGKFQLDWTLKTRKASYEVDLFLIARILVEVNARRGKRPLHILAGRVCEVLVGNGWRVYRSVALSILKQDKEYVVYDQCTAIMSVVREMEAEDKHDRQLRLAFGGRP